MTDTKHDSSNMNKCPGKFLLSFIGFITLIIVSSGLFIYGGEEKSMENSFLSGNTAFSLDLYQQLPGRESNMIFSPYSIFSALAVCGEGARGKTQQEIAKVLHLPVNPQILHPAIIRLRTALQDLEKKGDVLFTAADSLWVQKGYRLSTEYQERIKKVYGLAATPVDFLASPLETCREINRWVEAQTRSKITDIIQPGNISPATRLVVVDAIYFKGGWLHPFDKISTRNLPFYPSAIQSIDVPTMKQVQRFNYGDFPELQVLEMPYRGKELSMIILLPWERNGLKELENIFNDKSLQQWTQGLTEEQVTVFLPRFKQTCGFDLKKTLQILGIQDAFDGKNADFSGMDGNSSGKGGLYLEQILHKAFIEVNEEGTEAAAATAGLVAIGFTPPQAPKIFRANHPFIFLIRHNPSSIILFMGRVTHP